MVLRDKRAAPVRKGFGIKQRVGAVGVGNEHQLYTSATSYASPHRNTTSGPQRGIKMLVTARVWKCMYTHEAEDVYMI